jgi:Sec-independent protein translocase protein TatA
MELIFVILLLIFGPAIFITVIKSAGKTVKAAGKTVIGKEV